MPIPTTKPESSSAVKLSAAFLAEQVAYREIREEHRCRLAEAESVAAVTILDGLPRVDREQPSCAHLREKAEAWLKGRTLTARELSQALERTDEAVVTHKPILDAAKRRFDRSREDEMVRLARLLGPAHREAVHQLARALESVSQAISAERAVRAKLEQFGIGSAPAILPDASSELCLGTLEEWSSRISEWRRKYVILGLLD